MGGSIREVTCNKYNMVGDIWLVQKALIKAYSPHDLRSVEISNKSELYTAKMAQFTRFRQAFMVNGHYMYTKYE